MHKSKSHIILLLIFFLAILSWCFYGACCNIGFTLDEFSHVPYIYDAFNGHPQKFLSKFYSPFSDVNIDGLVGYRPVIAASFAVDYLIWKTNAFGWHLHTLLFYVATCWLSGLISFEFLKRVTSVRKAIFAGTLMAVLMVIYPGHPDVAATIVGRNDSLAAAFMLSSLYLYILFRNGKSIIFMILSAISFLLGLGSKETVVTLPAVLYLGELLNVFGPRETHRKLLDRLLQAVKQTMPFWIVLALFASVRAIFVHSLIGGYGKTSLRLLLRQLLNFFDKSTAVKIVLPINEHFPMPAIFIEFLLGLYVYPIFRLAWKSFSNKSFQSIIIFFIGFGILNVLPAFQIWHIYPNLVGFRLFFISSIAFTFLVAASLIPDSRYRWINFLNICWAAMIIVAWSSALLNNLQPFERAGLLMRSFHNQIISLIQALPPGRELIVTDLPMDYCGAPMLGKAPFLAVSLQPPFTDTDLTAYVDVLQDGKVVNLNKKADCRSIDKFDFYSWSNEHGRFRRLTGTDIPGWKSPKRFE